MKEVKHSLRALRIEACGKIKDFSVLNELENLELLELSGSNELPDLSFIKNMKSLKTFVFSMPVLDGDITPCLNLQYAAIIRGKRYYNLRDSQLLKGNENIEMWRRFE